MSHYLFNQLSFVRQLTLKMVEDCEESLLDQIPQGFNNHIRWNLGHIYFVQEKFAFHFAGEPTQLPDSFAGLFGNGTRPSEWNVEPPTTQELITMMREQSGRIQRILANRLDEKTRSSYTTSSGMTLTTIGEFLSFSMYHEGMHFNTIKMYKRLLST